MVYSNSPADAGNYQIRTRGYNFGGDKYEYYFLDVIDPCLTAQYTVLPNSEVSYFYAKSGAVVKTLHPFVSNVSSSICGDFVYSITYFDGCDLNADIFQAVISNSTPIIPYLIISPSYFEENKVYTIMLSGHQGTYTHLRQSTTFRVTIECNVEEIKYSDLITVNYYLGESPLQFSIDEFTVHPIQCNYNITYENYINYNQLQVE